MENEMKKEEGKTKKEKVVKREPSIVTRVRHNIPNSDEK
jgi:hypothetical protein